jgi:hypothetical protein
MGGKWQVQTGAFVTGCETAKCARRGIGLRTTRLFDVKTHAAKKREGIDAAGCTSCTANKSDEKGEG